MSADDVEFFEITLPLVARSLCISAAGDARRLIGDTTKEEFERVGAAFLEGVLEHVSTLDKSQPTSKSFDFLNLFSYPDNKEKAKAFTEEVGLSTENPSEYVEQLQTSTNAQQKLYQAAFILFLINSIVDAEHALLTSTDTPDYATIMESVDDLILRLHQICSYASSFDKGSKFLDQNISRIEGGRKGGNAKQARRADLKEHVLEKAKAQYASLSASAAAREIENLLDYDTWLTDDDGKPYYQDFVNTFTQWIRDSRNNTRKNP
ncbi:MAG: hypothetical protein HQ498_02350 [Pseudohongiella sp.]|nr:hypothetical protein [Pseudohongiella sp.]